MNRKQRRLVIEAGAITATAFAALIVLPTFISARDSMAVVAGGFLLCALGGWAAAFLYRLNKESMK